MGRLRVLEAMNSLHELFPHGLPHALLGEGGSLTLMTDLWFRFWYVRQISIVQSVGGKGDLF